MKLTNNYNLKMPEGNDVVNIEDLNYNANVIDNALLQNKNDILNINSELDDIKDKISDGKIEAYRPQLLNGFDNLYNEDDVYIRKCDGVVLINLRLTNKGTVSNGTLVFKIPANFSPVSRIGASIHNGLTGAFTGTLMVNNGGEAVLYNSTDLSDIRLNIVYMAR